MGAPPPPRFPRWTGTGDGHARRGAGVHGLQPQARAAEDRKSTRLNSSHSQISYAVFCLKNKEITTRLGQISPLVLISRTTALTCENPSLPPPPVPSEPPYHSVLSAILPSQSAFPATQRV